MQCCWCCCWLLRCPNARLHQGARGRSAPSHCLRAAPPSRGCRRPAAPAADAEAASINSRGREELAVRGTANFTQLQLKGNISQSYLLQVGGGGCTAAAGLGLEHRAAGRRRDCARQPAQNCAALIPSQLGTLNCRPPTCHLPYPPASPLRRSSLSGWAAPSPPSSWPPTTRPRCPCPVTIAPCAAGTQSSLEGARGWAAAPGWPCAVSSRPACLRRRPAQHAMPAPMPAVPSLQATTATTAPPAPTTTRQTAPARPAPKVRLIPGRQSRAARRRCCLRWHRSWGRRW